MHLIRSEYCNGRCTRRKIHKIKSCETKMESYLECFETTIEELKLYWQVVEDEDVTELNNNYKKIFVEYFGFTPHFKNQKKLLFMKINSFN